MLSDRLLLEKAVQCLFAVFYHLVLYRCWEFA